MLRPAKPGNVIRVFAASRDDELIAITYVAPASVRAPARTAFGSELTGRSGARSAGASAAIRRFSAVMRAPISGCHVSGKYPIPRAPAAIASQVSASTLAGVGTNLEQPVIVPASIHWKVGLPGASACSPR